MALRLTGPRRPAYAWAMRNTPSRSTWPRDLGVLTVLCLLPAAFSGRTTPGKENEWAKTAMKKNSPVLVVTGLPPQRGIDSEAAIQPAAAHFRPTAPRPDLNQPVDEYAESLHLWAQTINRDRDALAQRLTAGVPVLLRLRDTRPGAYSFYLAAGLNRASGDVLLRTEGWDYVILTAAELQQRWAPTQSQLVLCQPEKAAWPLTVADYVDRASLYERWGQNGEAIRDLQRALDERPDETAALIRLGNLRRKEGDGAGAEELYRRALAVAPDEAAACNNLAYLLMEQGRQLAEAERLAKRAVQIQPGNPRMTDTLGMVYLRQEQYARATAHLERARAQAVGFPAATRAAISEHLALAYHRSGHDHLVRQVLADLFRIAPGYALPKELTPYQ